MSALHFGPFFARTGSSGVLQAVRSGHAISERSGATAERMRARFGAVAEPTQTAAIWRTRSGWVDGSLGCDNFNLGNQGLHLVCVAGYQGKNAWVVLNLYSGGASELESDSVCAM